MYFRKNFKPEVNSNGPRNITKEFQAPLIGMESRKLSQKQFDDGNIFQPDHILLILTKGNLFLIH